MLLSLHLRDPNKPIALPSNISVDTLTKRCGNRLIDVELQSVCRAHDQTMEPIVC